MSLTVKEKEHWKERIARKIELAIETLCAEQDPHFRERVRNEARRRAIESLGIAAPNRRLAEIDLAKESLKREKEKLLTTMGAELLGADHHYPAYGVESAIEKATRERQKVHEQELLAADPLGRKILDLQREQEDLLDTVWLATSPVQIKQLWGRVAEILNQQPTALQTHALSLEPVTDDSSV
jgi:hypothetical protein